MVFLSSLYRVKGLLYLTRIVKLHRISFRGLSTVSDNVKVGLFPRIKSRQPCSTYIQGTYGTLCRFMHCTSCQRVICTSHFLQKDSSPSYDFGTDPDVRSWMSEMNSDFDKESSPHPSDTESEISSSASDTVNSSDDTGYSSDSSGEEDSEDESNTVKSSEVEEIDYEEFFLEEEEIRHEDLIEEQPLPIDLKRGQTGVFDVEEIVKILEEENGEDICIIAVPQDINYTDNLVVVTGKSLRHLLGMAELVRWIYKRKRGDKDPVTVRIEGLQSKDWLAVDLGNIVLHLMMAKVRKKYDLESLWLLGPEKDPQCQELERNPYILNIPENSGQFQQEEMTYDIPLAQEEKPEFYGMQSVAGWHEEAQTFQKPTEPMKDSKNPADPMNKES